MPTARHGHPVPTVNADRLGRRSRRAFALRTPLTLMALLAVLIGATWYAIQRLQAPPQLSPPGHCVASAVTAAPTGARARVQVSDVKVTVLNSPQGRPGLAAATSATLSDRGFLTGSPGNSADPAAGVAVVRGANRRLPSVALVLAQVPGATFQAIPRADPSVDLVLGSRFRGLAPKFPRSVPVTTASAVFPADCGANLALTGQ